MKLGFEYYITLYRYYGRIKDYELNVIIGFRNVEAGKKYIDMFNNSGFSK